MLATRTCRRRTSTRSLATLIIVAFAALYLSQFRCGELLEIFKLALNIHYFFHLIRFLFNLNVQNYSPLKYNVVDVNFKKNCRINIKKLDGRYSATRTFSPLVVIGTTPFHEGHLAR